jgi:hypothetical protein
VLGLALATPALADRPGETEAIAVPAAAPACQGDGVVAQVTTVSGAAYAQAPGRDPRSLSCDDAIHACETVVTSPGARVGLLSDDVYFQVDTDTRARLSGSEGAPELWLEVGGVRIVDPRGADAPAVRVSTPHVTASGAGVDAELWVRLRGAVDETRVCQHDGALDLSPRAAGPQRLEAGSCAEIGGSALDVAAGAEPAIGVADLLSCDFDVALDLTPTDVAAPPFGASAFPDVQAASAFRRDPCDNPGSGCGGTPMVLPTPPGPSPAPPAQPPISDPNPPGSGPGGGFGGNVPVL